MPRNMGQRNANPSVPFSCLQSLLCMVDMALIGCDLYLWSEIHSLALRIKCVCNRVFAVSVVDSNNFVRYAEGMLIMCRWPCVWKWSAEFMSPIFMCICVTIFLFYIYLFIAILCVSFLSISTANVYVHMLCVSVYVHRYIFFLSVWICVYEFISDRIILSLI